MTVITIRYLVVGLIGLLLLAPGLAIARAGDGVTIGRSAEEPIGIVEFDGSDGERVTAALRQSVSTRKWHSTRERKIEVIDRAIFLAAVEKSGSEEKAARELGTKLRLGYVIYGAVTLFITTSPLTAEDAVCVENSGNLKCKNHDMRKRSCIHVKGLLRFLTNTVHTSGDMKRQVDVIEQPGESIECERVGDELSKDAKGVGTINSKPKPDLIKNSTIEIIDTGVQKFLTLILDSGFARTEIGSVIGSKVDGAVKIGGDTKINVRQDKASTAIAIGADASAVTTSATIAKGTKNYARTKIGGSTAFGQEVPDATIEGDTMITAKASTVTTSAADNGAAARTEIGAISDSTIKGDTTINAIVGTVTTTAEGKSACAETRIGVIGRRGCYERSPDGSNTMTEPPFFPWPPPAPSLSGDVTPNFRIAENFANIDRQISERLHRKGYDSLHYFGGDGGFVVITDLERVEDDGTPPNKDRWLIGKSGRARSFSEYLNHLIRGEKGRFRMFAFIVGSREPRAAPFAATEQDTQRWKTMGEIALSAATGARPAVPTTRVWLYVYEFENSLDKNSKIVPLADNAVPLAAHKQSLGLK